MMTGSVIKSNAVKNVANKDVVKRDVAQRIERIHKIYADFLHEIKELKKEQNTVINSILKRIDHEKAQQILAELKASQYGQEHNK